LIAGVDDVESISEEWYHVAPHSLGHGWHPAECLFPGTQIKYI